MSKKNGKMIFLVSFIIISLGLVIWYSGTSSSNNTFFYDFEKDEIGTIPSEFTGTGRLYKEVQVVQWNKTDGHYGKVVEIGYFDERELFGTELSILFEKATKGIVEFDIYAENVENRIYLDICQEDLIYDYEDDVAIRMQNSNGLNILALNRFGSLEEISTFRLKKWYHFRIEFDVNSGWDLSILALGTNVYNQFQFYHQPLYFSQLYFATYRIGSIFYIDNVKISLTEFY